jgi:hypothetical protein
MALGLYIGFSRLNQLRFIARDPILTGVLKIAKLRPQSTLWRFLAALHGSVAGQLLTVQNRMRRRVWEAANVQLKSATLDTDATVHTLYGKQMGARKSYNPKNKGKKSYQPILTFINETREYVAGQLRNGDRPTGKQIARHLQSAFQSLPPGVEKIFARANSGFYCWEAVEAYEKADCRFVVVARKTSQLLEELRKADWKPSPKTDADAQCEFRYKPDGWGQAFRFVALRYDKQPEAPEEGAAEQYQLFETAGCTYRVFVTNLDDPIDLVVWFYNQRAGAENLIKEVNNDASLAANPSIGFRHLEMPLSFGGQSVDWLPTSRNAPIVRRPIRQLASDISKCPYRSAANPSGRFDVNCVHFQLAMLAYNFNCWLMLFSREDGANAETLKHTTLATARLRFLFVAAKIWNHAGRTGVSYGSHYEDRGIFQRLMDRLRGIRTGGPVFGPVVAAAFS